MNLSGLAVRYWLQFHKIDLANSLVITDDYSIPFGSLRMRAKGTHGGHNGLRDIQDKLVTNEYTRLRFGIGDDFPKGAMVPYVLGKFKLTEMEQLPLILEQAADFCESFILEGMAAAMNKYNK
jgi:PTH1 family peptidyl-tRNA hydrolase